MTTQKASRASTSRGTHATKKSSSNPEITWECCKCRGNMLPARKTCIHFLYSTGQECGHERCAGCWHASKYGYDVKAAEKEAEEREKIVLEKLRLEEEEMILEEEEWRLKEEKMRLKAEEEGWSEWLGDENDD